MSLTAVQADIFLHHLEIQSSNPERLSNFYSNIMDMKIDKLSSDKFLCDGPSRKIIITLGKDKTLSHAGMVCRNENNLNGFKDFLNQKELKLKDYNSELYKPGSFSVEDPDKNVLCFGVLKDKSTASLNGIHAPLQHLTFASEDVVSFQNFYENKLGFQVTDRVIKNNGELATCFTTSNHEHHTIACFKSSKKGMDHHSYEAGDWNHIKGWCDHFA